LHSRANQPFTDKKKEYVLAFNGEIYNYLEIRQKLIKQGIKFKTQSDTEVLFQLILSEGIKKTLKTIRGMFSFVFFDIKNNKIFCARDHFGQKPLYYFKNNKKFLVSTNIRAIIEDTQKNLNDIDKQSVKHYLCSEGLISSKKTFFKNIFSLPAGTYITIQNNILKIRKYFEPLELFSKKKYMENLSLNEETALKVLKAKIKNSVKRHLVSNTKIGVTCSGGIDSSLILAITSQFKKNMMIFTNVSSGIEKLSALIPKIVKKNNISTNHVFLIKQNKFNYIYDLTKLVKKNFFPARWGGGPPMNNLCKEAKIRGVNVLLGGDGLDEYFCGYETFNECLNKKKFDYHKILKINKRFNIKKNEINNFNRDIFKLNKKISKKIRFIKNRNEKTIIKNSILDTQFFLQNCTLPHADEYSMDASIEMRNPFLDLDLVEYCLNLPGKFKISKKSNFKNKYLIKKLAIRKYGRFINKKKEGTRNYSKFISKKEYWNFENFKIRKIIKIHHTLTYKEFFKLINLEILIRAGINNEMDYLKNMLSQKGLRTFRTN